MTEYIIQAPAPLGGHFKLGDYEEIYGKVMQEVVRCRDCRHYEYMGITQGWINVCTRGGHMMLVTSDGFCAWGEPKEN